MQGLVLLPLGRLDRPDSFVNRALAESSGFLRFRPGLFHSSPLRSEHRDGSYDRLELYLFHTCRGKFTFLVINYAGTESHVVC